MLDIFKICCWTILSWAWSYSSQCDRAASNRARVSLFPALMAMAVGGPPCYGQWGLPCGNMWQKEGQGEPCLGIQGNRCPWLRWPTAMVEWLAPCQDPPPFHKKLDQEPHFVRPPVRAHVVARMQWHCISFFCKQHEMQGKKQQLQARIFTYTKVEPHYMFHRRSLNSVHPNDNVPRLPGILACCHQKQHTIHYVRVPIVPLKAQRPWGWTWCSSYTMQANHRGIR